MESRGLIGCVLLMVMGFKFSRWDVTNGAVRSPVIPPGPEGHRGMNVHTRSLVQKLSRDDGARPRDASRRRRLCYAKAKPSLGQVAIDRVIACGV
jgi:hypothetical protein